ncbi:peptide-methionine (S)-S-oxide reductase [Flagellimonas algicola]|uniref:peptide-methionine (S)-S-oxide reductase n=1 Tax=Flagellimonas algicola TaxID=2583815 RepID=A0ABY2WPU3_9FLAO|nr:peptide-methionine (S)-S-oxide reductase [Allomuricauda algicola]TMU57004.1 peptide methionine sulfoxide reductase [Allomuricauda algicola]
MDNKKIALGGGCHWCTEAVFQSLLGVEKVEQGFVSPQLELNAFSEAVIVHFNPGLIPLKALIAIHLHTHKSTSDHSFRKKYRSAIYAFTEEEIIESKTFLEELQKDFEEALITKVFHFGDFKPSEAQFHDYYFNNPNKPFCETYISPKLRLLIQKFGGWVNHEKVNTSHEWT